jgi:hypothetical protein
MKDPISDEDVGRLTDTTRVIVSFGARDGGFELTAQLRLDIMDRYGMRQIDKFPDGTVVASGDQSFCYLDAITLEGAKGTKYDPLKIKKFKGSDVEVAVDLNKMSNPYWDTFYPAAVSKAAVMIFQVTVPWLRSAFCMEELAWFVLQGLKNLKDGKETPCVFMVFPEAADDFTQLLNNLRQALKSPEPAWCLINADFYGRMLNTFFPVQLVNMDGTFSEKSALHQRVDRLLDAMRSRIVHVPPGDFKTIGFTDYFNHSQQRFVPKTPEQVGTRPDDTWYEHSFQYKYAIPEDFKRSLFKVLDRDLQKVNIWPVRN